jgi:hypothetical protein
MIKEFGILSPKKFRAMLVLGILLHFFYQGNAQHLIRGIIVDSATFVPLPNVNIKLKNTLRGTITDSKGNFSIQATELDTLVISLVGYLTLEFPLLGYESGLIRLTEQATILAPIDIYNTPLYNNPYDGMFEDASSKFKKKIPFYYSKARKDKIKAARWREESLAVQTYVDLVINNPETKNGLMRKYNLTEQEYYDILTRFNEKHYQVMYYLTSGELLSLINRFFEATAPTTR